MEREAMIVRSWLDHEKQIDNFTRQLINNSLQNEKDKNTQSAVYWAIKIKDFDPDRPSLKIGETTNIRRRNSQLEDYHILNFVEVDNNLSTRLFIESYLRSKIFSYTNVEHFKTDYFSCPREVYLQVNEHFVEWVHEAQYIIRGMAKTSKHQLDTQQKKQFYDEHQELLEELFLTGEVHKAIRMTKTAQQEYVNAFRNYNPNIKIKATYNHAWTTFIFTLMT